MDYVEVVWDDAHGGDSGWGAAPLGARARRIVTVGQLAEESAKGLLVILSHDAENEEIGAYIFIPKAMVVTVKRLRVTRVRG